MYHSIHKSYNLPSTYIRSLRTFLNGVSVPLPIYRAHFSEGARLLSNHGLTQTLIPRDKLYGAVVISYGFHATLVADSDTPAYRQHGAARFGMVANELLNPDGGKSTPHAYEANVIINDVESIPVDTHGYILASLVSNLEEKFTISPKSNEKLDGKLRLVQFGAHDVSLCHRTIRICSYITMQADTVMKIMGAAYNGGAHTQLDEVLYREVNKLEINFKDKGKDWKWRRCCVDGTIVGVEEGGQMKVEMVESGEEVVNIVIPIEASKEMHYTF